MENIFSYCIISKEVFSSCLASLQGGQNKGLSAEQQEGLQGLAQVHVSRMGARCYGGLSVQAFTLAAPTCGVYVKKKQSGLKESNSAASNQEQIKLFIKTDDLH